MPIVPASADTSRVETRAVESLLTAILRGVVEARRFEGVDAAVACEAAEDHGLVALVAEALDDQRDVPLDWRRCFTQRAHELAVIDIINESEFLTLLDDLETVEPPALLMKGAQLAYSLYPRPDLRPRIDSDLLIAQSVQSEVESILERRGYVPSREQQFGDLLRYQTTYIKSSGTYRHTIDLHWRALDPQVFAHVLEYDALARLARVLPRLGPRVHGLHPVHALVLACVHRVAHHRDKRPLIWLYDIHLLASSFADSDWERFLDEIATKRVASLCARGLARAEQVFGTRLPEHVRLDRRLVPAVDDVGASYLTPKRRADIVLDDLNALPDWKSRGRLLSQYLFPSARYMRDTYAPGSVLPLPLLYVLRPFRGVRKWFEKPARS